MRPSIGFVQRLFRAHRHLEAEVGESVSQAKLGDLVAAEVERAKPYTPATVSLWFRDGVRDVDVIWGLARACGVNFLYLATGEGPMRLSARDVDDEIELSPRPRTPADEGMRLLREEGIGLGQNDERPAGKGGARRRKPG